MKSHPYRWTAVVAAAAMILAGCGSSNSNKAGSGSDTTATQGSNDKPAGDSCWGEEGCVPPGQPDVNGDGTVKIGILSPGDTNDHGYYQSFVDAGKEFADKEGWEVTVVDKVDPSDGQTQARNLCRQNMDMVVIAASELADTTSVAGEDVCKNSVWYVSGGEGIEQTPYFFQTSEDPMLSQFATGYATGLAMEKLDVDKGGFVAGLQASFTETSYKAWTSGIKYANDSFSTVATYTGDFDDAGLAQEATRSQLGQGVGILFPFLGGSLEAAADTAFEDNVLSVTPGTDRCAEPKFAISSIFSPAEFFAAALGDFAAGKVELGVTRVFIMGKDPVPTVKVCDSVPDAKELQKKVDDLIGQIADKSFDVNEHLVG